MSKFVEDIALFSDSDDAVLLSEFSGSDGSPVLPIPYFYYSQCPVTINGDGLFSDPDNSVLLLTDAIYTAIIGGPNPPQPTTHNVALILNTGAQLDLFSVANMSMSAIFAAIADQILNAAANHANLSLQFSIEADNQILASKTFDLSVDLDAVASILLDLILSVAPGSIPYELMTHAIVDQTALYEYSLKATGGNHLRRAVFGAPTPGQGSNHPIDSRFAAVGPGFPGILKLPLDPSWIGKKLKFKFCSFNTYGKGVQALADVVEYEYTPTGVALTSAMQYTQSPAVVLSQAALTYEVAMAQAIEQFSGSSALYNARTFTIPDPGGSSVTYYVTIYDPNQLGDNPGYTNLQAYCETVKDRLAMAGYIYIGSITATHAGGVTGTVGGSLAAQMMLAA